jgi:hypothetical protein
MKDVIFTRQTIDVMKKTVQIVTIPLNKEGWGKGDICSHTLTSIDKKYLIAANDNPDGENGRAQQLLVLSDDKIKESDRSQILDLDTNQVFCNIANTISSTHVRISKLIASYPQIEGTLPISKETVQAWIDSGTPEEGSVGFITNTKNHTEKYSVYFPDLQGNLLLEFGNPIDRNYPEEYELTQDDAKEWVNSSNTSIPTDEEIEEKAIDLSQSEYPYSDFQGKNVGVDDEHTGQALRGAFVEGHVKGYKQALKDLGHE